MMSPELTDREAAFLRGLISGAVQDYLRQLAQVNLLPGNLPDTAQTIGDTLRGCDDLLGKLRQPYPPEDDGAPEQKGDDPEAAARRMREALQDIEFACAIPDQNYDGVDLSSPPIVGGKVGKVERWIAARAAKALAEDDEDRDGEEG